MPQRLRIQLDARKLPTRIVLILFLVLATAWSYYAFRWYLGNTLAGSISTRAKTTWISPVLPELLAPTIRLHTGDWRRSQQRHCRSTSQPQRFSNTKKAVSLSPGDYRFWMALGTAREHAGEIEKAEDSTAKSGLTRSFLCLSTLVPGQPVVAERPLR